MEWRNQVAVVTGGARGIGRATARLLAQRGAAVCVNYAVHADAAEAVVAEIGTAGGRSIAVAADVTDPAAVEAMVGRTEAELGPVMRREWKRLPSGTYPNLTASSNYGPPK
jgi:3-oxoacyl-[acyl-carrier protein] reductase